MPSATTNHASRTGAQLLLLGPDGGDLVAVVGDRVRILADGEATGGQCAVFEGMSAPGVGPPLHRHANEDEYFYVQEGTVKFSIDGKTFIGRAGSFVLAPRGSVHTFVNVGNSPSRMLISVTPSGLEKPFRENAALFKRNPSATTREVEAIFNKFGVEFVGPPLTPDI